MRVGCVIILNHYMIQIIPFSSETEAALGDCRHLPAGAYSYGDRMKMICHYMRRAVTV